MSREINNVLDELIQKVEDLKVTYKYRSKEEDSYNRAIDDVVKVVLDLKEDNCDS